MYVDFMLALTGHLDCIHAIPHKLGGRWSSRTKYCRFSCCDMFIFYMKIIYLDVYVDLSSGVGFGLLSTISVVG